MNDTLREYTSYWKFAVLLLRQKRLLRPVERRWGGKNQYFLFFSAPERKRDTLVVYLHGGGWNSNSPKEHWFVGQKLALGGYDCAMLGYRKTPRARWEEIEDDVFRGWWELSAFLLEQGKRYEKTVVMGSSAGAQLGAMLCFDRARRGAEGIAEDAFDALVSLAGPLYYGLEQTGSLNWLLKALFGSGERSRWTAGEPYAALSALPGFRIFLIQSRHDGLVGFEQAEAFREKAAALGMECELYEVEDAWNTHSAYCVGCFLRERGSSKTLDTVFRMLDKI